MDEPDFPKDSDNWRTANVPTFYLLLKGLFSIWEWFCLHDTSVATVATRFYASTFYELTKIHKLSLDMIINSLV